MIHANMFRDTLMLLPDDVELVGFYDVNPDAVKARIKPDAQHVPFYNSIPELIEKAKPDVVMVSTYMDEQPDWALQVAEAGVNVWMEKPFAVHSSQLLPVKAAIEKNNLVFSCGYSWRFHPISRLIKQTYDDGLLGKPYSIEFRFLTSSVVRRGTSNWAFDPARSGGGILNWLGCHWFDLMRFLTSSEVTKVAAIETNVSGLSDLKVEDGAAVSLQFANGMLGSLHAGYFTPGDGETAMGMRGSQGWAKWNVEDAAVSFKSIDPRWATAPVRKYEIPAPQPAIGGYGPEGLVLIKAMCDAVRGNGSSGFTIDDAIKSLQIIEAAHEAAKTGKTVELG